MKVAYITGSFPCISESFIAREISALQRRGFEISVFALDGTGRAAQATDGGPSVYYRPPFFSISSFQASSRMLLRDPARFIRSFSDIRSTLGFFKALRHFVTAMSFSCEAERRGIEHIHAHFAFVTADIASAMVEMCCTRYTLSVHAWDLYVQSNELLAKRVRGVTKILACTQHGRDRVMAAAPGIAPDSVAVMRHGLMPSRWSREERDASKIILTVGRLVPKKGILTLIDACRLMKHRGVEFSCTIVGDGPERSNIESAITNAGLMKTVILKGELTGDSLREEFNSAAIFALPSVVAADGDRDGLPNAVLEAMAMQLPVVVSSASAAPEVVQDGKHGYVVAAGNAEELADRLTALLKHRSLCRHMGERGRELIESDFDIDKNIAMIADVFSACISEGRARRDK